MKIKEVFCANEQESTPHVVTINDNNEYVFTCECGRFLKFPTSIKVSELQDALRAHKEVNEGQVSVALLESELDKKLSLLDELE